MKKKQIQLIAAGVKEHSERYGFAVVKKTKKITTNKK